MNIQKDNSINSICYFLVEKLIVIILINFFHEKNSNNLVKIDICFFNKKEKL